jgi:lipopolysaccharide/colanic/teichoic acid biosynthesis glycosyltransferase
MKRSFDIAAALVGLLLLCPIMLLIAVAIKFSSPGPVLYSQIRVGLYGRLFRLHKFRSMVVDAEHLGSSVTTSYDSRITPIGQILRRTKLDELPQLWNVLCGDMSLVGPRPDVPAIVATYSEQMRHILDVRPGITSIASLHLRCEEELLALAPDPDLFYLQIVVPTKIELAMEHVRRRSFLFDLFILLHTVWALTLGRIVPDNEHPLILELRQRARNPR